MILVLQDQIMKNILDILQGGSVHMRPHQGQSKSSAYVTSVLRDSVQPLFGCLKKQARFFKNAHSDCTIYNSTALFDQHRLLRASHIPLRIVGRVLQMCHAVTAFHRPSSSFPSLQSFPCSISSSISSNKTRQSADNVSHNSG